MAGVTGGAVLRVALQWSRSAVTCVLKTGRMLGAAAGLALAALPPSLADAACFCGCSGGQAASICSSPLDIAAPCQRICPQPLTGGIASQPIVLPGTVASGGGVKPTDPLGNPLDPNDPMAQEAQGIPSMNVGSSGAGHSAGISGAGASTGLSGAIRGR